MVKEQSTSHGSTGQENVEEKIGEEWTITCYYDRADRELECTKTRHSRE